MDSRNIIVLDLETTTIVQNIKMPGFWNPAKEMVFSSDGRWMYTFNAARIGDRHVVKIDTKTHKIDRLIPLPKENVPRYSYSNVSYRVVSPDEECLYFSLPGGIYRMNIKNEQIARVSDITENVFLAFTPKGEYLLGANAITNSLLIIDPDTGKQIDSIAVGKSPQYIIVSPDSQKVYVSNWASGDVSVLDLSTRKVIATIPVGVNPSGMTITPDGRKLYVAITAQTLTGVIDSATLRNSWRKVVVIDTETCAVVKEITPGQAPRFINVSPDGTKVYTTDEYGGKINILDTSSDKVIDSILLTRPITYAPDDIAVTPDGSKVFVHANSLHQILVIDTITHALLARFDAFSDAIAISADGRRAYIPGATFTVIDIPSLTARYVKMPDIKGSNYKIVLSKDERIAYIADVHRNILQVVDLENWRLIANVPVGKLDNMHSGLAITPDGNKVFVCNGFSKNISVVSTAENKVIDTISMAATPNGVDISPDGRVAYVIEHQPGGGSHVVSINVATHQVIQRWEREPIRFGNPFEVAISPDGKQAYFGGVDGEVVVILDIATGATRYVDVGLDPFNIALTKDGQRLYVSNGSSDDITVIDTKTETVADRIPIQVDGIGFIYVTMADSQGNLVSIGAPVVSFVPYDQGIQNTFKFAGSAVQHPRLDGCWIPVSEGDYMLWVNTNRGNLHYVSQIYDGISDFERRTEAPRIRVRKDQITSVNFVLQGGYQLSGTLVDQDGKPVSAGGNIVNTQARVSIRGFIGFASGNDGHFFVVVPEGTYDLYFDGILAASGLSVRKDLHLGQVTLSRR